MHSLPGSQHRTDRPGGLVSLRGEHTVGDLVFALRRHRLLILMCTLVAIVIGALYTFITPPVFEATSVLRLETEQVNLPQLVQQLATENRIGTEMEVLRGRSAVAAVVDSLGLRAKLNSPRRAARSTYFTVVRVAPSADTATLVLRAGRDGVMAQAAEPPGSTRVWARPGDTIQVAGVTLVPTSAIRRVPEVRLQIVPLATAVRGFESALKVFRPARDVDVIDVRVKDADPVTAAAAANLLAEQRIAGEQQMQVARTESTIQYLTQQLDTLGTRLRGAEDALRAYRERAGVVAVDEQASAQVKRLAQLQADRAGVEAERNALLQLVKQLGTDSLSLRTAPGSLLTQRTPMAFPTLLKNPATAQLLGALASVENERTTLLIRRTPQDPDVRSLTARIQEIHAQLKGIAETYLQGLTDQTAALDSVARRFSGALDSLPSEEVQTARLQRDVTAQQNLYTLIQTRLKEAEITRAMKDNTLTVVDPAVVPDRPTWPIRRIVLLSSLAVGLLCGIAGAVARAWMDTSVRSRADAVDATGLPVVGTIPRLERRGSRLPVWVARPQGRLASGSPPRLAGAGRTGRRSRPGSMGAAARMASMLVSQPGISAAYVESFNQLHANLMLSHRDRPLNAVVFTSALPGEGKTLSAINFALTVAARNMRVLLVDADLRCGFVNEVFGCARSPGFTDVLHGLVEFDMAAQHVHVGESEYLTVLPAGGMFSTSARCHTASRIRAVLDALESDFDLVIIDSPPVNVLVDAAILGSAAGAVILVARPGKTRVDALRYATDQLLAAHVNAIGTLLNDIDIRRNISDDDSYRYLAEVERYYAAKA